MTKVVFNNDYDGIFAFSKKACRRLIELGVSEADMEGSCNVSRHDPLVIQVVEELGDDASGEYSELLITTIEGKKYTIEKEEGAEWIKEPSDYEWIEV